MKAKSKQAKLKRKSEFGYHKQIAIKKKSQSQRYQILVLYRRNKGGY